MARPYEVAWHLFRRAKFMMGSTATESGHEGDERLHGAERDLLPEAVHHCWKTQLYRGEVTALFVQFRALERAWCLMGGDPKMTGGGFLFAT